jgi:hypothetical protein
MDRRRALAAVSGAQLAAGLAGLAVALRRGRAYEFLWLRGRPEAVAVDSLLLGTALSAPAPMLAAQAALTVAAARGGDGGRLPAAGLGLLGAAMVAGYLGERLVRRRLGPAGWDMIESPVAVAGIGLAAAMAWLGAAGWRDGEERARWPGSR